MKTLIAAVALVAGLAVGAVPAMAANARHPNSNVDKRVDKGGSTGDDRTEQLNQAQLDSVRSQNAPAMSQPMGAPMQPMGR